MNSGRLLSLTVLAAGFGSLWLLRESAPLVRLAAASVGLLWVIKVAAMLWQKADGAKFHNATGLLCLLFVWPAISVAGFERRREEPPAHTGERFLESWVAFMLGTLTLVVICLWGKGEKLYLNYLALGCMLCIIHLGLVEVGADLLRLGGFAPASLFNQPWRARSLREFWSQRWNLAFVQMNRIFLVRPLREKVPAGILTFSIFVVSGLLHEIGISYPDGVSWGKPLLYFVLQGAGLELERHWRLPRPLVMVWVLLPLPLLFTPAFVNLFLGGLGQSAAAFAAGITREQWLATALTVGGLAHVCVLAASLQVPARLRWSEEFGRLSSINRKVFRTYGAYIFAIIVFQAGVSLVLARHVSTLGSPASLLWLVFIAAFWWARVLTDVLYMKHTDWPQGPLFTVGHTCLSTLFLLLALNYSILLGSSLR